MNCQFCHKPMKFSHFENNKEIEVYDCWNCPMLIYTSFFQKDGEPVKTTFMLEKNGKRYMWVDNRLKNSSYVEELTITEVPNHNNIILKLPKLINVTPENVYQKFSFYMVFA